MEKKTEIITRYIVKSLINGCYVAGCGALGRYVHDPNNAYLFRNKVEASGYCYSKIHAVLEIKFEFKK